MLPLQKYLSESGFDGLVWQAGKGNPSSLNNFLLENTARSENVFVCIDLESGVPALFPLNILTLFRFYLPKAFKYGNAMFDNVDTIKLKQYVYVYKISLEQKLGKQEYSQLLENIDFLEYHQKNWKSMSRLTGSIQYQLYKGYLSEEQAHWLFNHPIIWYIKELNRAVTAILNILLFRLPLKIFNILTKVKYKIFIKQFCQFLCSHSYRLKIAQNHVSNRIQYWQNRRQINHEEAIYLFNCLIRESTGNYLNDFAVHMSFKVFIKALELLVIPLLYTVSLIDEVVLITWLLLGGSFYRTIYIIFRMIQASRKGQEIPWVAFIVGILPTFGILAYPCQIIYSAVGKQEKVAQFVVYDFFTRLGTKIPGWGGEDTLTEHFFNHCAYKIICYFKLRRC